MKRNLWPHQQDAIKACLASLDGRPGYVQMPTGSGKGEVIRSIANYWITQSNKHKVIIGVPNHTLAFQIRAQFIMHGCVSIPTLFFEGFKLARASRIVIATYMSLARMERASLWRFIKSDDALFIADECHHINNDAHANVGIIYHYKNRIGFSATPWSDGCTERFDDNLIYALSIREAQQAGALCKFHVEKVSVLSVESNRRHQIMFVRDGTRFEQLKIAHSVFFDDSTDQIRPYANTDIIERFRDGLIQCIYANRMLLEGFDCAKCKSILIEKETQSQILAYQMAGRGMRIHGTEECRIQIDNEIGYATLLAAISRAENI